MAMVPLQNAAKIGFAIPTKLENTALIANVKIKRIEVLDIQSQRIKFRSFTLHISSGIVSMVIVFKLIGKIPKKGFLPTFWRYIYNRGTRRRK